jgi:GT2 family glycosyltransferase
MSEGRRKCIFVLGMHRSGTSAMAGLLARLGFPLGKELMAANDFNEKGYFENNRIYKFNEKLLGFLGAGWDETFLLDENWIENKDLGKFREELLRIIDEDFSDTPIFVIKDPRICVLLPLYQEVFHSIDIDSQYIIMVRHPEEIWLSLQRREQFSDHKSYLLWMDHILRAEYYSRDKERIFIYYEDLLHNSLNVINRISLKFGFDARSEELIKDSGESFIEPTLRHYEIDAKNFEITDESGQDLFDLLLTLCVEHDLTPAQQKLLDHIRHGHQFLLQRYRQIPVKEEHEIVRLKKIIKENELLIQRLQEKQERGEAEKAQHLHDIEEERLLRSELDQRYAGEKLHQERQISDLQRTLEKSREADDETRKELARLQLLNRDEEARLKNLENDLKDIRHSLTYRLGALLTYPFHWTYRQIAGNRKANETKLWLLANLVAEGIYNPKSLWQNLDFSKLRVLYKALQQEDNANILGNFQKLLNGVEAVNGTPDVEEDTSRNQSVNIRSPRIQVLYVSPNLPDFDTSSGGKRATEMLRILAEAYDVHCFTLGARPVQYIDKLQSLGVNVLETSDMEMVCTLLPNVDVIIFAWYYTYYSCAPLRKIYPDAITIADTVDVHWVREERSIGHYGDLTREKVEENKRQELEVYRNVDQIWTVTEVDTAAVRSEIPEAGIALVSNIHEPETHEYKEKKEPNILFFGGYQHYPNIAAAQVLAWEIFPLIRSRIPNATLFIAGSKAPEEIIALAEIEGVEFLGFIEEKDVPAFYDRMALTIVPLLSGAGIKGKICQAISYRIPVITNAIGNEGIGLIHEEEGLISEDFDEMADLAVRLLQGGYNLEEMTSKAQEKIVRIVGPAIVRKNMIGSISPPVSICIVTWNRKELLKKCIDSILKYTQYPQYRILVHSNACSDGTREYLEELSKSHPNIIPIFSEDNEVFVIPNNRMMMMYPQDDVVLLNNDTEVTQGWLVNLWRAAYSSKKIGIAGSKILYPDGRLQEFGSELYPDGTGRNIGKYDDPGKPEYQGVHKVGYVSGCAMYIKRSTIEIIGVFDEAFHPCYCEDSDFCYTAWEQDLETVVTSDSVIYHHEGATSGTDTTSGFKAYQEVNMEKFLSKHKYSSNFMKALLKSPEDSMQYPIGARDQQVKLHALAISNYMDNVKSNLEDAKMWVPAGHYYSPIPSKLDIIKRKDSIYGLENSLDGIDMSIKHQLTLLEEFSHFYDDLPFSDTKSINVRYYYENSFFSYGDAIILYCMMRYFKPKRIIEIGSGFSSAVMLDTNDYFLNNTVKFKFIEPFPDRLKNLLRSSDKVEIIEKQIQEISIEVFSDLNENDIVFIDSTHVSKVGSDVNHIFFNILPSLRRGVIIHIHDISSNFELPFSWVMEGRAWNENYLLRAFLMYNNEFKIQFFNSYLGKHYRVEIQRLLPKFLLNPGGSIWLRKVQ